LQEGIPQKCKSHSKYRGGCLSLEGKTKPIWLFDEVEIKLKYIWLYKHYSSFGGSLIIIQTDYLKSSGKYIGEDKYEEVGIYKGRYITRSEYDVGWAKIKSKKVKTLGKSKLRVRYLCPDIFFIAPKGGPLIENAQLLNMLYEHFKKNSELDSKLAMLKKIRRPQEIRMYD